MYTHVQKPNNATRIAGMASAIAMTAALGCAVVFGMNMVREPIEDVRTELALLSPPPPPPLEPAPEPLPIEIEDEVIAPPAPELFVPELPVFVEEPPPIVSPPAPVIVAAVVTSPISSPQSGPKLLASDKPAYPTASRRNGEQGTTHLRVCISATGRVTSVEVASSSGHTRLDDAAAKWIRGEKFRPARHNGHAQDVCGHDVFYQWSLQDA